MNSYSFSLLTETPLVEMDDFENIRMQLIQVECIDALIHSVNDNLVLDFERRAESVEAAIKTVKEALSHTHIKVTDTVIMGQ
ncbi:hypothetical protein L2750_02230 [Shewanella submarina]|uniref:Uncharacterized protein n=1 Tax=Shewanella submarina TaxID=2016376 RepID=A0ABV7GMG9_9GAMM|nr:hypothetical protein [Shewanella submarina]MCL1035978.1 hypothetical protein [Shewanella submarina]